MARCPIVRPSTQRLMLPDGEWIEVKRELNAGEYRDMIAAQFKDRDSGGYQIDVGQVGLVKILAYVVAWSYVDMDGETILPIDKDTLRKFDTQSFSDIRQAVEDYDEQAEKRVADRKNAPDGEIKSALTSPSAA